MKRDWTLGGQGLAAKLRSFGERCGSHGRNEKSEGEVELRHEYGWVRDSKVRNSGRSVKFG